jgi:hypothetical protein
MGKDKPVEKPPKERKLKILVSSVVCGYEDLMESVYALWETSGTKL